MRDAAHSLYSHTTSLPSSSGAGKGPGHQPSLRSCRPISAGQSLQSVFMDKVTRCKGTCVAHLKTGPLSLPSSGRSLSWRPGGRRTAARRRAFPPPAAEWLRREVESAADIHSALPRAPARGTQHGPPPAQDHRGESRRDHLKKTADRLSLPLSADAGHPATEPAGAQPAPVPQPISWDGTGRWRLTLASLRISPREAQIIESILAFTDDEASIAVRLRMSRYTVRTHLARLYRKVGVTNRCELMVKLLLAYMATRRTHADQLPDRPLVSPDQATPLTLPSASSGVPVRRRAARGESPVSHRDGRATSPPRHAQRAPGGPRPRARRDD
jgi:DNA-binding CsgD family transcriptional regulator